MIQISYKNKDKEARALLYSENNLDEIWYDIKQILDNWAEILWIFKINK